MALLQRLRPFVIVYRVRLATTSGLKLKRDDLMTHSRPVQGRTKRCAEMIEAEEQRGPPQKRREKGERAGRRSNAGYGGCVEMGTARRRSGKGEEDEVEQSRSREEGWAIGQRGEADAARPTPIVLHRCMHACVRVCVRCLLRVMPVAVQQ